MAIITSEDGSKKILTGTNLHRAARDFLVTQSRLTKTIVATCKVLRNPYMVTLSIIIAGSRQPHPERRGANEFLRQILAQVSA